MELQPHVLRLLLHREATSVLADAFELYANAYERSILLREFYGKEATLFTVTSGSNEDKEKAKKGLSAFLEGVDIERKRRILSALKENLTTIFNNPDKGAITHAIVHRALWEYLQALTSLEEGEQEKLRRDMFEMYVRLHLHHHVSHFLQLPGCSRRNGAHQGRQPRRP
mgnify:CR=1 FL=1